MRFLLKIALAVFAVWSCSPSHAADSELANTTWQLVKIMSMDDSTDEPNDPSLYSLTFDAKGTVSVIADCNRATASWSSQQSGHLRFGPVAATQALCTPGSISEKYLAQFPWVRSYVMKNGHLFLATMADGSIIEFQPQAAVVTATVLGEEIHTSEADEMQEIVLGRLFDRYAEQNGLNATEQEVGDYIELMKAFMAADENINDEQQLTADEAAEVEQMRRDMGSSLIRHWKINRALYRQYGGRLIYQQFGPEPLDAYRQYLEERQTAGDFKILVPALADSFWRYFTDESIHDFMEPGSDDEKAAFKTPPWEEPAE